jgi:hypothetical protein
MIGHHNITYLKYIAFCVSQAYLCLHWFFSQDGVLKSNTYFCFTFLALIPSLFHITKQAATVNWEGGAGHNVHFNNIFVLLSIHTKILSSNKKYV